jgi:hypothetical protein
LFLKLIGNLSLGIFLEDSPSLDILLEATPQGFVPVHKIGSNYGKIIWVGNKRNRKKIHITLKEEGTQDMNAPMVYSLKSMTPEGDVVDASLKNLLTGETLH